MDGGREISIFPGRPIRTSEKLLQNFSNLLLMILYCKSAGKRVYIPCGYELLFVLAYLLTTQLKSLKVQ